MEILLVIKWTVNSDIHAIGKGWFNVESGILGSGWSGNGKWNDRYNSTSLNLFGNNILHWLIKVSPNDESPIC